jgi:YesN/AraC family two-component response regulator
MGGDLLFINEYELHKIDYSGEGRYTRYVITFKRDGIQTVLNSLNLGNLLKRIADRNKRRIRTNLKQRDRVKQLLTHLHQQFSKQNYALSPAIQAEATITLVQLLIDLDRIQKSNVEDESYSKSSNLLKDLIKFLDANYTENISLDLLEKNFFLSRYHLSRVFKKMTSFTIVEYLHHKRIIKAQKMLTETSEKVIDICHEVGFNNIQHFCRVFKKIAHTTPYKYRKSRYENFG